MAAAVIIVINSVIGAFDWKNLVWLAASAVLLQVSDYSQMSNYIVQLQPYRMISEKKLSSWCTNHILGNCNG